MIKKAEAAMIAILFIGMFIGVIFSGSNTAASVFSNMQPAPTVSAPFSQQEWADAMRSKKPEAVNGAGPMELFEWDESFSLYAAYPKVMGRNKISSELRGIVQNKAELFKDEAETAPPADDAAKPELTITYKTYKYENNMISIKFVTDAHTGATFTDGFISTYVYDLKTEKRMSLKDVFNSNTGYLHTISGLVRDKLQYNPILQSSADKTLFEEGIAPRKSNYSNFVIENGCVRFFFNRLQIAPAEDGTFEVALSFESLAGVLRPEIMNPPEPQPQNGESGGPDPQEALPVFLQSGGGEMKAFGLEGIDPLQDKVVALTFDDGPNPSTTGQILNALKKYGGHATFFLVGDMAEEYPSTVRKIYAAGNEIGNHSYSHADFFKLSMDEILDEIDKNNRILYGILGVRPILVRAPYGNVNLEIAKKIGRPCVQWTVDSEDWKNLDEDMDYHMVMDDIKDGDIVLMHDIYQPSADAAERIIRDLNKKGYKLVTISQMIQIAGIRGKDVGLLIKDLRASKK
jgi:peptidoglycan/xylan/chitin deacetylase (PgdA/CDA1 family)